MSVYERGPDFVNDAFEQPKSLSKTPSFISRAVAGWQRRRAISALERLNDWQLEDIGVARNDIARVVDGLLDSRQQAPEPILPALLRFGRRR